MHSEKSGRKPAKVGQQQEEEEEEEEEQEEEEQQQQIIVDELQGTNNEEGDPKKILESSSIDLEGRTDTLLFVSRTVMGMRRRRRKKRRRRRKKRRRRRKKREACQQQPPRRRNTSRNPSDSLQDATTSRTSDLWNSKQILMAQSFQCQRSHFVDAISIWHRQRP